MKKLTMLLILALAVVGPVLAPAAPLLTYGPFSLLPNPLEVGGGFFLDATSGGANGNWGLGGSYTALDVDLRSLPMLTKFSFGYSLVAFQYSQAKAFEATYDLTPYCKGLVMINKLISIFSPSSVQTLNTGLWAGQRLEDGKIVGGIVLNIGAVSLP